MLMLMLIVWVWHTAGYRYLYHSASVDFVPLDCQLNIRQDCIVGLHEHSTETTTIVTIQRLQRSKADDVGGGQKKQRTLLLRADGRGLRIDWYLGNCSEFRVIFFNVTHVNYITTLHCMIHDNLVHWLKCKIFVILPYCYCALIGLAQTNTLTNWDWHWHLTDIVFCFVVHIIIWSTGRLDGKMHDDVQLPTAHNSTHHFAMRKKCYWRWLWCDHWSLW